MTTPADITGAKMSGLNRLPGRAEIPVFLTYKHLVKMNWKQIKVIPRGTDTFVKFVFHPAYSQHH